MTPTRIAVVDDEAIVRTRLRKAFAKHGYSVETYASGEAFLDDQAQRPFDLAFVDLKLPKMTGIETLAHVKARFPNTEIILITGHASIDSVVEAVKLGAYHYVTKPLNIAVLAHLAEKALERKTLREENRELKSLCGAAYASEEMIGAGPAMRHVFDMIAKVAPLDCNVLIRGDSGTGKELAARSIHRKSRRKDGPFVAFNCAGFAEDLIAAELFGYQRGAFTGATATKIGILETAHTGTVFMDEIGDMPLAMQGKLLRVIQERQIIRVGANRPLQLDLRFIAATNKDLRRAIREDRFREDLYFRLNVVQIELPPLIDRKEDIPLLLSFFIGKYARRFSKPITAVAPEARDTLLSYAYPGNVRELENIIERAVALADNDMLTVNDLPDDLRHYSVTTYEDWATLETRERDYLVKVLAHTGHNLGRAAKILGLSRTTLWRKMKRHGISLST